MNTENTVINILNGIECMVVRSAYLKLQESEAMTNEQYVSDAYTWDSYLSLYISTYNKLNKIAIQ